MKKSIILLTILFAGVTVSINARTEEGSRRWSCPGNDKKFSDASRAQKNCPGQKLDKWEKDTTSDTDSGLLRGGGILGTGVGKSKKTSYVKVN